MRKENKCAIITNSYIETKEEFLMNEYILFVDETQKTPKNPFFCISGVCFMRSYYENIVVPQINELKEKHFGKTSIIFHYSDMNNKKDEYEILKDTVTRQKFWTDYTNLLDKLDFKTFGVYFNQDDMKKLYGKGRSSNYDIAFVALLKNYLHYLKSVKGLGSICIESRGFKENSTLQNSYYNYIRNGSMFYPSDIYEKHLSSIGFLVKGDNCVGLQIADFAPSALLREINGTKDHYSLGKKYRQKLYCYNNDYESILGLKNLL